MKPDLPDRIDILTALRAAMTHSEHIQLADGCSLLEHSLWTAFQAVTAQCSNYLIVAALFHDIGHSINSGDPELSEHDRDKEHAELGAAWLSRWFIDSVCSLVAMHIDAKRYLATVNLSYRSGLSSGSHDSLNSQGGLMLPEEIFLFQKHKYFDEALQLRRFDDMPYTGEPVHPYTWYEPIIISMLR